jgi:hypothetical protein
MKNIFLVPILFVVTNVFSQKYDLNSHPLHSDVWRSVYDDSTTEVRPKNFNSFTLDLTYLESKINPTKIQSYLFESFNKFRTDYGVPITEEDSTLTLKSIEYSKYILSNFVHSKRDSKRSEEAICTIPMTMFSRISEKDGDINKIIADCCFDIFVGSPAHMSILLNEDPKRKYGFGITVTSRNVSIVVQSDVK